MLEAWSEVDKDLVLLNGNAECVPLERSDGLPRGHEPGDGVHADLRQRRPGPRRVHRARAALLRDSGAANAENIIDAGGTQSDNTSIWLVAWGEETVHGIFPKGSKAGLVHEDFGEVTVEVTAGVAGNRMRGLQERYQWKAGLVVKDWRYVVRIANIDVSDLALASPTADLIDFMEAAEETIPNELGRRVFYMNRRVRRYLRKQTRSDVSSGGGLTYDNVDGKPRLMFGSTPIRRSTRSSTPNSAYLARRSLEAYAVIHFAEDFPMFIDALLMLSDSQALTGTAAVVSANTIDLGNPTVKRDIASGEPMVLVVTVEVALAGTTPGSRSTRFSRPTPTSRAPTWSLRAARSRPRPTSPRAWCSRCPSARGASPSATSGRSTP